MAKETHDREDLLRDATGLVRRAEFETEHASETIVCGFREGGELSIYFGQDDVAQFNAKMELRRGYSDGKLIASYRRQLCWLERDSTSNKAKLVRIPFSSNDQMNYLDRLEKQIQTLADCIKNSAYVLVGRVPTSDENLLQDVAAKISNLQHLKLAMHPGIGRRP